MKIGVIGTGNMGSLIIDALINSKSVKPKNISVMNRTEKKALDLAQKHPGLTIRHSPAEVIRHSAVIFLCVKPLQFYPLLQSVRGVWRTDQLAVSITSPITVGQLEKMTPCPAARVVPSIVNQVLAGSTLVTFGTSTNERMKSRLWRLLEHFSHPIEIGEEKIRAASDLSSCGPAFLSFLLEKMADGAVKSTQISKKEATELTAEMVIGFGKLLERKAYSLAELRNKVTVKGGVTGVGLNVLNHECGAVFEHLFEETQKKFLEDHLAVDPFFDGTD